MVTSQPRADGAPRRGLARRDARWNVWLSVVLLAGIVVLGNSLAHDRLALRRDLSADQLYAVAPVTQRILAGLEDRLQVRTYFTRDTQLGDVALGRARIEAQLAEFRALGGEDLELVEYDPVASSAARSDAERAGIRPVPVARQRGAETIQEEIWLGLVLRYRGREQVIPFAVAWRFEVQFASAVHALTRDRRTVVGFLDAPVAPRNPSAGNPAGSGNAEPPTPGWPTFGMVQGQLARTHVSRPVYGLAEGLPVAPDIDVVVVVASQGIHPRAVFELDRFVQRGGSLIVAVDDPVFNGLNGAARLATPEGPVQGELGVLLRGIGADVRTNRCVWDPEWQTAHGAVRLGADGQPIRVTARSPAVVTAPKAGLSQSLPPTRDLPQVTFYWAHPIVDAERNPPPEQVRREDLVWTSPRARLTGTFAAMPVDPQELATIDVSLRTVESASFVLAAAFTGNLPSSFRGRAVPEANNPLGGTGATLVVEPSPMPPGGRCGSVVVVGDADWLRDPEGTRSLGVINDFADAGGSLFLENLVDWLILDEDLIALRSRIPRERPLVDFEHEAFIARGLLDVDPYPTDFERRERERLVDEARASARLRRWRTILGPIAAALAILAVVGVGWNLRERRRPGLAPRSVDSGTGGVR